MKIKFILLACAFAALCSFGRDFALLSPDGKLEVKIDVSKTLNFSVKFDGESIVENCQIGMDTSLGNFGENPRFVSKSASSVKKLLNNSLGGNSQILDNYNRLALKFDKFSVEFRAYDDALAYRFISEGKGDIVVKQETAKFPFNPEFNAYPQPVNSFHCFFEDSYRRMKLKDIGRHMNMAALPFVFDTGKIKVAIIDSDVSSYPKMNLKFSGGAVEGAYAPYPKEFERKGGLYMPKTTEDYISKSQSPRAFPWRGFIFAREDANLVEHPLQYKLACPSKIKDTSWIEPGTCAWDWWNNWGLFGVDFQAGQNMLTYKYYVDFASKFGMKYFLLDEGWLGDNDKVATMQPKIDIKELVDYANKKNVKILLWCLIRPFNFDAEKILDRAKSWGVAGLKIDFLERDDQIAVELLENIASLAAERKLLVDFHGCPPSSGLHRKYPNVINFEGVRGGENNKGGGIANMTPSHNIDLVFMRSLAGPMDYTPGAMRNLTKGGFGTNSVQPSAQGSRAHQMAMYVCFFEPLKMLSDSPSLYLKESECTAFMAQCPTSWDETIVLDGK
ncbi:MAG: glycoside hydrolase family 97 catalytic domain-containing protein, partial [Opitutales bacterium]|nr:glycoside hydrolase family 97 catalytic domain-containing protein [Opitutales bacterium]